MAELREYQVVVNGNNTIMRLDEQDAERLGATPVDQGKQSAPSTLAEPASSKARTASNKGRATRPANSAEDE